MAVKPVAVLERPGSFSFSVPVNAGISCGDYVLLSSTEHTFLGQVDSTSLDFVHDRQTQRSSIDILAAEASVEWTVIVPTGFYVGKGRILAEIGDRDVNLEFDLYNCAVEATIALAPYGSIGSYFDASHSKKSPLLPVGTLLNASNPLRVNLNPDGFKRHTGVFGQSGSGKSFALAILLEELHLETIANIVVLDPNGDFVHFKEPIRELDKINHKSNRNVVKQEEIDRYANRLNAKRKSTKILSMDPSVDAEPIVIRFSDLDVGQQALLLDLDPGRDREEYHSLSKIITDLSSQEPEYELDDLMKDCRVKGGKDRVRLRERIESLELEKLGIWGKSEKASTPLVTLLSHAELQTVIIDLSTLSRPERTIVSTVVFSKLWNIQTNRKRNNVEKPCILFVDEAHNLFPAKSFFPEQTLTLDWGSRIAGEGRKFGLYFLISSQLPSKIHEHVLTQCGNIILMKMMSQSDIDVLGDSFSFVSEMLLQMSRSFKVGEALIIGSIVPAPCLIHFEGRKTQEGGKDFDVKWT